MQETLNFDKFEDAENMTIYFSNLQPKYPNKAFSGVKITLGHRTWPGIFTTWSVINFSNFKLCPVILWRKSWKLFSSFLGFQVIYQRSKNNKLKDVYLPCNLIKGLGQFLITESPLKTMKNAFYFTLKAILVLKIFKFLFCLFGHVEKRLD